MKFIKSWYSNFLLPTSILVDLVIGAGVFTLPYVFTKSGFLLGFLYLIFFGILALLVHLMYAEIVVKTKERHRLVGYANLYLGRWGFWPALFMVVVGDMLVMGVFLILGISFFSLVWAPPIWIQLLILWGLGTLFIFLSEHLVAESELFLNDGIFLGALIVFLLMFGNLEANIHNLTFFNLKNILTPLGPIAFSFLGIQAIPLVIDYFKDNTKNTTSKEYSWEGRVIVFGTLVPILFYALFSVAVFASSHEVSPDSISGLVGKIASPALVIVGLFGIVNLRSSYTIIGRNIRDSLVYDLGWKSSLASLLVVPFPLLIFYLFQDSLIQLVSFIGDFIIIGYIILIILIWFKVRKKDSRKIFID